MEPDRQLYEIAYLINPAHSEEEAQAFQQSLKNETQSLGGFIDPAAGGEGSVIKRRLAHTVKKTAEAYLGSFRFLLPAVKISELKSKLSAPQVLRFILVHTKPQPARTYRPRQEPVAARISAIHGRKLETAPKISEPIFPKQASPEQAASDIEEIDKKLEEILGK